MSLWADMEESREKWMGSWVVGGDFNMVLKRSERTGDHFHSRCVEEFKETLDRYDIIDLLLVGGRWMWSNQRKNMSCSRIDRFVTTTDIQEVVVNVCQKRLNRLTSYHFPITLESNGIRWGPCPFRLDDK